MLSCLTKSPSPGGDTVPGVPTWNRNFDILQATLSLGLRGKDYRNSENEFNDKKSILFINDPL